MRSTIKMLKRWVVLTLLILVAPPSFAQGDQRSYVIDDAVSAVDARVSFFGFGHKTAHFPDMNGSLRFAISNYEDVDMTVVVDARTLTTGDSETRRLRGKQFFDVEHHPDIRFVARHFELTGDKTARVDGDITARGVTQPATIALTFSQPPFETTGSEVLGVIGVTTIDRRKFGMTAFPLIVGNKVKVTIRARMVPG